MADKSSLPPHSTGSPIGKNSRPTGKRNTQSGWKKTGELNGARTARPPVHPKNLNPQTSRPRPEIEPRLKMNVVDIPRRMGEKQREPFDKTNPFGFPYRNNNVASKKSPVELEAIWCVGLPRRRVRSGAVHLATGLV